MRYQPIFDIAEICARKNIREVVLCPGSRCAPLTLAFTRHPQITTRTFSDERSAGFVALGIAQATNSAVAVVCTSGTAAYNLAPAVAEAWFSNTPLVVFTADRPAEWIAQHDGQTIFQKEIFGKHVKQFFELPQEYDHPDSLWAVNRTVNDAVNLSVREPRGPVHINAPFREPLYPDKDQHAVTYSDVRIIHDHSPAPGISEESRMLARDHWSQFNNVLMVVGQDSGDEKTLSAVSRFHQKHSVPVVHDIISNLHEAGSTIQRSDLFLGQASDSVKEMLKPDLLITFGKSLISKNLKLFLRKYRPARHWHIQSTGPVPDTFRTLTDIIQSVPEQFINFLADIPTAESFEGQKQKNYLSLWAAEESRALRTLNEFFAEQQLTELALVRTAMASLPDNCNVHLANSMSVRYANFLGLAESKKGVRFFSNRGTSGIDGSTSTAVGHALISGRPNVLITGDLAFFYDRNAFWHNYPLENLRILLLNNHGGLIFDVLEGPSSMPEASEYFITRQKLNARKLCEEYDFTWLKADNTRKIRNLFKDFFTFDGQTKVMELETDTPSGKKDLEKLKLKIKNSYEPMSFT